MNVFQGVKTRVIVQLKNQKSPFTINVHYMSNHTNLAIQIFFKLGILGKFEDVLQNLYAYFFIGPRKTQEFVELTNNCGNKRLTYIFKHQNLLNLNVAPN